MKKQRGKMWEEDVLKPHFLKFHQENYVPMPDAA
jgi:hypothetical protein